MVRLRKAISLSALAVIAPLMTVSPGAGETPDQETTRRVLLHLRTPTAADGRVAAAAPSLELLEDRSVLGAFPRQRNPELSSQHLVVVVLGEGGEEITRVVVPDPRIVRAELPGPEGDLESELLIRDDVEWHLVIPDDPNAHTLEVFHPRWTGTAFVLDSIGSIQLR
jgi:hypothetical protein